MHVIATAGHVDHGKSSLLKALTGTDPDRWEEERRRGLTIDLGYAWLTLPSGEQVAFVDVPGHERFVPNMLAGMGPVPAVLMVVAADEGWMPQSAEHLAVVDALGIRHGLLVVTRCDLADPGQALAQAQTALGRTSLECAGAVTVSARTGAGLPELIAALDRLVAGLPSPDPGAPVRLWVDRSFSVAGSGTVVTGTLPAGTVHQGDELVIAPAMRPVRVRAIQSLDAPVTAVTGVTRAALNLRGVSRDAAARGMALIHAGRWTMADVIDVRITSGPGGTDSAGPNGPAVQPGTDPAGDLASRLPRQLTLHIGSARTLARVRPLGGRYVRLTLREPLPLHAGDRILLRDPGGARTRTPAAGIAQLATASAAPPARPPLTSPAAASPAAAGPGAASGPGEGTAMAPPVPAPPSPAALTPPPVPGRQFPGRQFPGRRGRQRRGQPRRPDRPRRACPSPAAGRACSGASSWTSARRRWRAAARRPLPCASWPPGPTGRRRRSCCGGTACCAPAHCWRWASPSIRRRLPGSGWLILTTGRN